MKETVLAIHQAQLLEHDGLYGVRDGSLSDSALARLKNVYAYAEGKATPRLSSPLVMRLALAQTIPLLMGTSALH